MLTLEPQPAQFRALLETMEAFNRACQHVADIAFERRSANKIALQPLVYAGLRSDFRLSSQMVVRCISRACEAYKADKRVHVQFDLHDPMVFDQRILAVKSLTHVSVLCLSGRQLVPYRFAGYTTAGPDKVKGQADLLLRDTRFMLAVCVDLPGLPPATGLPPASLFPG